MKSLHRAVCSSRSGFFLFNSFQGAFDGGAVEAFNALTVDFSDGDGGNVFFFGGVHFLVFDTFAVEPIHEGVAVGTGRSSINFYHMIQL